MSRARLLIASAALLGLCLLGANRTASAQADPDLCYGGTTHGEWDLPTAPGDTGFADGVLFVGDTPYFFFDATLTEVPSPALSLRTGEIKGYLYDIDDPDPFPVFAVKGVWQGSAIGGTGSWKATIYDFYTGEAVGSMEGNYSDPGPYTHQVIGKYEGEWVICERP
jgi:hypothetical protein